MYLFMLFLDVYIQIQKLLPLVLQKKMQKSRKFPVQVGKFMMSANGKSLISKEERGFIKVIAHKDTRVILGAQMMCARATDMIGEFVTAVVNELTVEQLLAGMRAHPTYNEAVGEALEEVFGEAIHVVPKKTKILDKKIEIVKRYLLCYSS